MQAQNEITNPEIFVMEYSEGCGFNAKISFDRFGEHFEFWASRYQPFNRSLMQQYINRKMRELPGIKVTQELIYSTPFELA